MCETRYFRHEDSIWKFAPGQQPQLKTLYSGEWGESVFESLEEFLAEPSQATEITVEEAEKFGMEEG